MGAYVVGAVVGLICFFAGVWAQRSSDSERDVVLRREIHALGKSLAEALTPQK